MRVRTLLLLGPAMLVMQADVHALVTPSTSDGPVRLLGCVVTPARLLQAEVDNSSDEAMFCEFSCNYEISGRMFSHAFSETIPKHFQGRIGQFDASGARPGNYSGEVGKCSKASG
ncbi:MAG TPA: hypothetical protein VF033_07855 [Steroidobacteraceae bacterium]|jgi:hypothetical protein